METLLSIRTLDEIITGVNFKPMRTSDLQEVKQIYDWYILNTLYTFHSERIRIEQLKEFIYTNHPVYKSFMIYFFDDLAGYCFLTNYKKRQAYNCTAELSIYLKPEFCGLGIGGAALRQLEISAKEVGLQNIIAMISWANKSSIALFRNSGYSKCAHFKNMGEKFNKSLDLLAFQKIINPIPLN